MTAPHNVEFEAAKFLQKLIHDSKDEPEKLATKLYVILQHMKASGKENSMPYQVISRAMETVTNQHGLDVEALMSSRVPLSGGSQMGEASGVQQAGSSQPVQTLTDSRSGLAENDTSAPGRLPAGLSSGVRDTYQGSHSHRNANSFDHESPSSVDTRSASMHSHERRETGSLDQQGNQTDAERASVKRKRSDPAFALEPRMGSTEQVDAYAGVADTRKGKLIRKNEMPGTFPGSPSAESSAVKGVGDEYWKQGFLKGTGMNSQRVMQGHLLPSNQGAVTMANPIPPSRLAMDHAGGISNMSGNVIQDGIQSNRTDTGMLRGSASGDTGKSPMILDPSVSSMPFKEHHLKQLRAQCLVFLAFRNGLMPKNLHLEIALGNMFSKEGSSASVDGAQKEPVDEKGKEQPANRASEADSYAKDTDSTRTVGGKATASANPSVVEGDKLLPSARVNMEADMQNHGINGSSVLMMGGSQLGYSNVSSSGYNVFEDNAEIGHMHLGSLSHVPSALELNKQPTPELMGWIGSGVPNEASGGPLTASVGRHDLMTGRDVSSGQSQIFGGSMYQLPNTHLSSSWKAIQEPDGDQQRALQEHDEDDRSTSACLPLSTKYSMSEKWIMAHRRRKLVSEQKWAQKQQKADQRIAARLDKLKEAVSLSKDISAKTRSVIELKKLQLLELQRCLRRDILDDFFRPISVEMDRLRQIKKHRTGRRPKIIEKYDQRMKEERHKRIRERQKEFFSEIEVHKERLEDVFKFKRERLKGFNRYVKELHKRKERTHREKNDRIQREKINLLKINDVEGYLRMVQDAKSDRVNQLLKETEKYLQKLGSKLKDAKATSRRVEVETDENGTGAVDEIYEIANETEDENDQAKHYKESNEKYYMIAHSIKENITEQPAGLRGGKLREYQMNGLRWLVSLYNNHLNGILADEMGLGKTVQVISLLLYLMEMKNDRGPFLVVVPSSVLPGWEQEISFWAPGINKIIYAGPPEERRRLFKESIIHLKFNVLLTTYEYLMNKHDRPKLSKIYWHYVIIDEGHRIKNASCKLNADLKHYHSSHRLLLTGTPLQNNLEELWALLNFLLPNIFNSSEDFSQWFNKPFESSGDSSADEVLLSEEENLLIINRLHQVLRPFVLRRLKHKVENQLPEKIERLIRCEASAYQKLLMKRVEENLGSLGMSKARAIHNSVIELRNICNHPYLSQLHAEEVDSLIPKHFLPPIVRLCGKLEMLDRLLPKLKATNHRVLLFSTMTRLLDVMEEYLVWKQYRYLRLDGQTSGLDRGALIEQFNQPGSPFFIFLLSIRAGGVGVNLQAADTVIIFDTDWNPQVDLQAQARAHRIGQKKDVLVLRLETINTVEEQVRAAAEHKLGVANQSITAGFFDNNTSAEDRREYLESLLRECKKEEAATVLDDEALNDVIARSESEIDVFESMDQKRREEEMAAWNTLVVEQGANPENVPLLPSRLVTEDDLKPFYEAMKVYDRSNQEGSSSAGLKRDSGSLGGFDTQHYGRGKRAREVRSYEERWNEEEFEKMCQADSPESSEHKGELTGTGITGLPSQAHLPLAPVLADTKKEITPPVKRGRGRPRKTPVAVKQVVDMQKPTVSNIPIHSAVDSRPNPGIMKETSERNSQLDVGISSTSDAALSGLPASDHGPQATQPYLVATEQQGGKGQGGTETVRRRGRKSLHVTPSVSTDTAAPDPKSNEQPGTQVSADVVTTSAPEAVGIPIPHTSASSASQTQKPSEQQLKIASSGISAIATVPVASLEENKLNPTSQSQTTTPHESDAGPTSAVQDPNNGRQQDKNASLDISSTAAVLLTPSEASKPDCKLPGKVATVPGSSSGTAVTVVGGGVPQPGALSSQSTPPSLGGHRPGKRQSQKFESRTEPVRRRGRRCAQTVTASTELSPVQDPKLMEPLKGTTTVTPPTMTCAPAPSGTVPPGLGSSAVTVPVIPVVPVSSVMPGSAVTDVAGSMHHINVSSATGIPVTSQLSQTTPIPDPSSLSSRPHDSQSKASGRAAGRGRGRGRKSRSVETAPRRRGRKSGSTFDAVPYLDVQKSNTRQTEVKSVELVECKAMATSGEDKSSQASIIKDETCTAPSTIAPGSQDSKEKVQSSFSSSFESQKGHNIAASPDVKDLASLKSKAIDMPPDSRATSMSGDVASCSPADPLLASSRAGNEPPKTPAGKTHTIVLALESVSVPEGLAKDYTAGSALPSQPVVAEPLASKSSQAAQSHLVEEMSAPPGFDKPKTWLSDATVGKSKESGAGQASKTPEGKTNFVVLALESGARNVDMLSVKSGSTSEKEASSEVQRNKDSVPESAISSNPKAHRLKINSATDIVANSQLDEIPPPPGFGIQKTGSSDVEIRKSLESDDVAIGQNTSIGKQTPESENKAAIGSDKISIDANQASEEDAPPGFTTSNLHSSDPKHSKLLESGHTDLSHGSAVLQDISGPKPVIAAVSDVSMAELSHPNEDSVPPGFGVPQTSLAQENNGRPSESEGGELPTNELQTDAPSVGIQSGCDKEIRETVQALQTAAGTGSERSGKGLADDGDLHVVKEGKDIVPDNKLASKPVIDEALVGTEVPLSETTSETQDQCLKECDLEIQAAHIAAAGDNATSEKCEELVNDGNLNVQVEEDLDVDNAVAPEPDIENSGVVQTQIPPSKTLAATSETDPVKSATLVMNAPLDKHVELEAVDGHSHVQKEDLDHKQDLCLEPEANEVEAQKSIGASAPMQEDGKDETKQLATVVEIVVKSGQLEGEDVTTSDSSQQDVPSSEVPHDVGRSLDVDVMPEPMECEQESTNTEVLAEDVAVRLEATDAVSVKDDVGENAVLEKPPEAGDTNTGSGTGASISNQELGKEDNDITAVYVEKTREEYQSESRSTNMNACQMDSGSCEVQPANNNVVVDAGETVDPVAISLSETCEKGCVDYAKSTDHGKQSSQPMTESSTDGFSQVASPKISTEGQKDELISANASSTGASHVQADSASESKVVEESQGPDVGKAEVEALAVSSEIRGSSRQQSEENNPDSSPCNITGSRLQEENEGVSRDVLNDGDSCQIQPSVSNGAEVISQPEASEVGSAHTVDNAVNSGIDTARVSEPETCQESSPIEAGVVGTLTESKQAEEHAVVQEDNQNDGGCDIPQIVESDIDITVMSKSDGCELRTVQATDVMEEDVANPQEPVEACTDVMEVGQGDGGTSDVHQSFDVTSDVAMIPEPEAHEEGERHVTGLMDHVADSGKQVEDNADISHGDLRDGASCGTQGGVNVNRVDDVHPQPEMFGEKSAHTTNSADEVSESMQLMENTSALEPAGAVSIIECQKDEAQSEEYVDHDVDIQDRKDGASSEKLPDNGDTRASTHVEASDNVKDWEKQPEDDGTHTVPEASDMVEVQKNEDLCEKLPADDDEILTDAHAGSLYIEGQLHEGNVNSSVGASGNMEDEQKHEDRCEELPDDGKTHSSTHVGSSNIEDQKDHTDSKKYCKGDDACTAAGASGNIEDQQKNEDQCEKLTDGTAVQVGSSEHIEGQNNKVDCEKLPENDDTHTGDGNSDNFKDQKMNEIRDGSSEHFEGQKKEVECEKLPEYDDTNTADGNSDNFEDQQMNEIQDGSSEHVEGQKKEVECEKLPEYGDTHTADGNSDNFEDQQMNEIQDGSSEHVEGQKKEVECEKLPENDDTHTAAVGNSDNVEGQPMNEIHHEKLPGNSESHTAVQIGLSDDIEGQKDNADHGTVPEVHGAYTSVGESDIILDQQMNEDQCKELPPDDKPQTAAHFGSSDIEIGKSEAEGGKFPDDADTPAVGVPDNVEDQQMNEIQVGSSEHVEGQKNEVECEKLPEKDDTHTTVGNSDNVEDQPLNNEVECEKLPENDDTRTTVGNSDNVEDQPLNEIHDEKLPGRSELHTAAEVGLSEHIECQKDVADCGKAREVDDARTSVGETENILDQQMNEDQCKELPDDDKPQTATHVGSSDLEIAKGKADGEKFPDDVDTPAVGASDNIEDQQKDEYNEKLLDDGTEKQKDTFDSQNPHKDDDVHTTVGQSENMEHQQKNEDHCEELSDGKSHNASHDASSDIECQKDKAYCEKPLEGEDSRSIVGASDDVDAHTIVGASDNIEDQPKIEDHHEELPRDDIQGQKDETDRERSFEGDHGLTANEASEDQQKMQDRHEELPCDAINGQTDKPNSKKTPEGNETDEMEDQIFEDCCENLPDDDDDNDNDNDETCTTPHVVSSDRKDDTEGEKMLNSDGIVASGLVETPLNQPGSGSGSGSESKVQEGPHDMEVD